MIAWLAMRRAVARELRTCCGCGKHVPRVFHGRGEELVLDRYPNRPPSTPGWCVGCNAEMIAMLYPKKNHKTG